MNLEPRLIRLARRASWLLVGAVALGTLGALAMIFQARLVSQAVAAAFLDSADLFVLQPVFAALFVTILVRALITFGGETFAANAAIKIKKGLREELFEAFFNRGPIGNRGERSGELSVLVNQAVEALDAYFSQYLPQLALAALIPISLLVVVFPMDALSAVVLLLTAPLIPLFMVLIGKGAEIVTRRQFTELQRLSAHFLDILQGITLLKSLNQSKAQIAKIAETSRKYRILTMDVLRITFLSSLVLELVATISTAIVAVQIGLRVLYWGMNFEQAFFILLLAPEFYFPLRQLGLRFHAATSGVTAANRIFQFLQESDPVIPAKDARFTNIPDHFELITFENVTFHYEDTFENRAQGSAGVENLQFSLSKGERITLIGPSGAGKTTIGYLLLHYITPQSGRILVEGSDLSDFNPSVWRRQTAWVSQNAYLFAGTVAENILLGKPNATLSEMEQAVRLACLDDWIASLPKGYETRIGEGGEGVSGGQLQRIAIARAILKDPPLLILDEPTSHLDPELETRLDHTIRRLCQERIVMTIAHRRSTIINSDRIIIMDRGRILDCGTPAELAHRTTPISRLLQAGRWES